MEAAHLRARYSTLFREQIEVGLISRHLAYLTFHISNEPALSVSLL
jgi:hypothetical protein